MTPKEKAENLFRTYRGTFYISMSEGSAKQCALILVNEIINELTRSISPSIHGFRHNYWQKVKQEIEKL